MMKFVALPLALILLAVGRFSVANGLGIDFTNDPNASKFPGRVSGVINKVMFHGDGTNGGYIVEIVIPLTGVVGTEYKVDMVVDLTASAETTVTPLNVAVDDGTKAAAAGGSYGTFVDPTGLDKIVVLRDPLGTDLTGKFLAKAGFALSQKIAPATDWTVIDGWCFSPEQDALNAKVCGGTGTIVPTDFAKTVAGTTVYAYRKGTNRRRRGLYLGEDDFLAALVEVSASAIGANQPVYNGLNADQESDELIIATDATLKAGIDYTQEAKYSDRISGRITKVFAAGSTPSKITGLQVEVLLPKGSVFGDANGNYRVRASLMSGGVSDIIPIDVLVAGAVTSIDATKCPLATTRFVDPAGFDELFILKSGTVDKTGLENYAISLQLHDGTSFKQLDSLCFAAQYAKDNEAGFCGITDTSLGPISVVAPWVHSITTPDTNRLVFRKGTTRRQLTRDGLSGGRELYFVAKDFDAVLGTAADGTTVQFGAVGTDQVGTAATDAPAPTQPPAPTGATDAPTGGATDAPTGGATDAPTGGATDAHTTMPGDAHTTMPGDAPTTMPGDAPTTMPGDEVTTKPGDEATTATKSSTTTTSDAVSVVSLSMAGVALATVVAVA